MQFSISWVIFGVTWRVLAPSWAFVPDYQTLKIQFKVFFYFKRLSIDTTMLKYLLRFKVSGDALKNYACLKFSFSKGSGEE